MSPFQKAVKVVKKARIGVCGVAGSGKTLSALRIARGLCAADNPGREPRIALADTENNSSVLYADRIDFDVLNLTPPFEPDKYIGAIHEAEKAGYDIIILDSISHAWAGEGGLLDMQGKLSDGGMNSFTAWRKLTPKHNQFIEAMVRSQLHVIATMRSKMDYVVETSDRGKAIPKKVGLAPIQREGMDYEFDIVFDIDLNHNALAGKDRSSLFDGKIITLPGEQLGETIGRWLARGNAPAAQPSASAPVSRTPLFTSKGRLMTPGGDGDLATATILTRIRAAGTLTQLREVDANRKALVAEGRVSSEENQTLLKAIQIRTKELAPPPVPRQTVTRLQSTQVRSA